jgi:NAD(P)H dehydrogenase (quinone)
VILVTGANGLYGRSVIENLLARMPSRDLAVSVRDPAKAADLARQGCDVRHGDFDQPETLCDAFAGAETVLINGTNYGTASEVRAHQQAAAIRAAEAAGVSRIVITSWQDLDNCRLEMASDFPGTEKLAAASAPACTILRLTYGMATALARDVKSALSTGALSAPAGDARATPAAAADLAEATANVLAEEGHSGKTYELTGPETITWDDLASLASTLAGQEIRYCPVSDDEFRAQVAAAGWPPAAVEMLIAYYGALRDGWASTPSSDLAALLHRPPVGSLEAVRQALTL